MVRVAVFSDIHCGYFSRTESFSVPGAKREEISSADSNLEKDLIRLLVQEKPDFLLIAGDLTSVGSPQEFYACEQEIKKIAGEIGLPTNRIICCMGNHDIDFNVINLWKSKDKLSEEILNYRKEKYQHLASSISSFCLEHIKECQLEKKGPAPFSGVYEAEDFVAIVLNTSWLCGPNQEYSHGKLSLEQLDWFEKTLDKYISDDRKRIVLMHHHPFNYPYPTIGADISQIEEGAEFVEVASKYRVDLVIHGHRHHPKVKTEMCDVGYPVTFFCAGSLAVNANHRANGEIPNTIHFIDIDKNRDFFVLHNYSYSDAEGWKPMENKRVTPMDGKMKVGKVFERTKCAEKIEVYKNQESVRLEWEKLDECLQFMRYQEVMDLLKEQLGSTHYVIGSFPGEVALLRKE